MSTTWAAELRRPTTPDARVRLFEPISSVFAALALATVAAMAMAPAPETSETRSANGGRAWLPVHAPATGEWMFAGYSGVPYTLPSDVTLSKPGVHDLTVRNVAWEGRPFVNPIYYGARIVRFGEGRFGGMLDFTHSKAIARLEEQVDAAGTFHGAPAPARAALKDLFGRLEASHGHNMLTLNGLFRLPRLGFRLQPYVGIGAGVSLPHAEVQVAGPDDTPRTFEYQMAGAAGQALAGLEIRTARVSYFVEYKFTLAPYVIPLSENDGTLLVFDLWRQLRAWLAGEEPPGGHVRTTFTSHQGIFGLGIRSAPAAPSL